MPNSDNHVTICPYFTVPEGKMGEFKAVFADFYKGTKAGTKECIYYGFSICGNQVFCREGYKSGNGALAHLADVKAALDKAAALVGPGGIDLAVMGPPRELAKIKPATDALGAKYYDTDRGSMWFGGPEEGADTHVTICPTFTVPDGKMRDFKRNFNEFYKNTRSGTGKDGSCFYYGFAVCGDKVFCREGYKNGEGALAHLGEVDELLKKAAAMVGENGLNLSVMGPPSELAKLKEAMAPLGAKFWETDAGSTWYPAGSTTPKLAPAASGATEMKVTMQKSSGVYVNAACAFLRGVDAKPAQDGKEAMEAKAPVQNLRITALGDAINVAVSAANKAVSENLGTIEKVQTCYPDMEGSGRACGQIVIDLKKK